MFGQNEVNESQNLDSSIHHYFSRNIYPPINEKFEDLIDGYAFFKIFEEDNLVKVVVSFISDSSYKYEFSSGFLGRLNTVFKSKLPKYYTLIIPVQFYLRKINKLSKIQLDKFEKYRNYISKNKIHISKTAICLIDKEFIRD